MATKEGAYNLYKGYLVEKLASSCYNLEYKQSEFAIFRVYVPAGRQTKSGILIFFFTSLWHVTKFGKGFLCEPKIFRMLELFKFHILF
jgi:hypothetical protein